MPVPAENSATLPPAQEIRDAALEVVTRSEYDLSRGTEMNFDILQKISEFIRDLFSPFSSALNSLHDTSPFLWWVTVIGLIALLLALVAHIIWSIRQAMRRKGTIHQLSSTQKEDEKDSDWWEEQAREAVASADYIVAIRFLLNGALIELERLTNSKIRRGATNREYLRRFQRTPAFHPLQTLVETIDLKWYGGQTCMKSDYETCIDAYRAIQSAARRRDKNAAAS